jgi:LmbE family N-acetylglucosaminyl deacetylase
LHLYLAPHLDDAVLSCGGLIARQSACGDTVVVMTVCAGDPPAGELSLLAQAIHFRWGLGPGVVGARRAEDRMACGRIGASVIHLPVPDSIYRQSPDGTPLYPTEESLFGPVLESEDLLVVWVSERIREACSEESWVYCPAALGGHIDHRLTRRAAERLGRGLWYYSDLPYAARGEDWPEDTGEPPGVLTTVPLAEEEVQSWADAAGEYRSQLSTFWQDLASMTEELRTYHDRNHGIRLWAPL